MGSGNGAGRGPVTAERWSRIGDIFAEAMALTPEARGDYLAAACGADADLHREVDSLIRALPAGPDILERPAASLFALADPDDSPSLVGSRAGPYLLVRE